LEQEKTNIADEGLNDLLTEIQNIEKYLPDILYSYLNTLYFFVMNKGDGSYARHFHCGWNCESYYICKSYIHYLGLNCVDETNRQMYCPRVKQDRTKHDEKGNVQIFRLHLRPYTTARDSILDFLTMRIHFTIGINEITIGHIGKHLFLAEKGRLVKSRLDNNTPPFCQPVCSSPICDPNYVSQVQQKTLSSTNTFPCSMEALYENSDLRDTNEEPGAGDAASLPC
jgi:hypothetical protein